MKFIKRVLPVLIFFLISNPLYGQIVKKNKIGIALSGGGAKGIAHIGVLKVLEEAGIYPSFITGTSMGSIVGGLYATGYSAQDLDSLAHELEWVTYFSDQFDRSYLSIEEKNQAERYLFSFPFDEGKIQLPRGFIDGQKLGLMLSQLTIHTHDIDHFDDFEIPFRCVATNLETGEAVVFDSGFLPDAIRSSIGIPSVFEPFEINSEILVDGGVARNLPVIDAKEMGADYVIAVDVGAPLYKKEEFMSILDVLDQTSSFRIVESNLEQLKMANFVIRPDISRFSATDFSKVDSLIMEGERITKKMLPALRKSLDSIGYNYIEPHIKRPSVLKNILIQEVEITGVDENIKKTIRTLLQMKPPQVLSPRKLDNKIKRVIATGFFQRMDYRLLLREKGYILQISAKENRKTFLKLGGNYDSDLNAALLLNATLRNPLIRGSKLTLDLRVSDNPALLGEYLVYTKTRPNVGFRISSMLNFFPVFSYEDASISDEFNLRHGKLQVDLFSGISKDLSFSSGIGFDWISQDHKFARLKSGDLNLRQMYFQGQLILDTYNRLHFPTSGTQLLLSAKWAIRGKIKNDLNDNQTPLDNTGYGMLKFTQVFKFSNRFTLHWYNAAAMSRYKATNYVNLFYLGRRLHYESKYIPFTGFAYMERTAGRFAFSGLRFQLEPFEEKFISLNTNFGLYKIPFYALVYEDKIEEFEIEQELMAGIGLELGAVSRFGPVIFQAEYNLLEDRFNFAFQLGFDF